MVTATKPTTQDIELLGGLIKIYVDTYSALIPLNFKTTASVNGTQFIPLKSALTGANYSVPGGTNLQIWGIESFSGNQNTYTVIQFGYADDAAGTNFVSLYDIFAVFGGALANAVTNNTMTSLLTVPTGKFPQVKTTNSVNTDNLKLNLFGLQTV